MKVIFSMLVCSIILQYFLYIGKKIIHPELANVPRYEFWKVILEQKKNNDLDFLSFFMRCLHFTLNCTSKFHLLIFD